MELRNLKQFLIYTKTKLIDICQNKEGYYLDQLEYLINLIDYFITERIEVNIENLNIFLDEIVTTSVMQADFELLDLIIPFSRITGDIDEISL